MTEEDTSEARLPEDTSAAWLSIAWPPGGGTHMRIAERDDDGLVVDAVYVHGPEITASVLQSVPVSHLATAAAFADSLYGFLVMLKYGGFMYPVSVERGQEGQRSARHVAPDREDQATAPPARAARWFRS